MKLFKLKQSVNSAYDTFDSMVVAAESEEEARRCHPMTLWDSPEDESLWDGVWADPGDVSVEYIGEAAGHVEKGVILASFNAG